MYLNVNNSVGLVEKNQILPDHDVLNSKELNSRNTRISTFSDSIRAFPEV